MTDTYPKIGTAWVNINPHDILWTPEFIHSRYYEGYIEKGKSNIEHYVNNNKTMLSLIINNGGYNSYAIRQLIYHNSSLSSLTGRLQTEGRRYYHSEAIKRIKSAITSEYTNLPEFFRIAYSIDDVAHSYFYNTIPDLTNQINKEATAYFYQSMRDYIYKIL